MGDNPEYSPDTQLYSYSSFCGIGLDLWQVKSGTIFDNILITDDIEAAKEQAKILWEVTSRDEKKMKSEQEAAQQELKDSKTEEEELDDEDEDDADEEFDDIEEEEEPDHDEL